MFAVRYRAILLRLGALFLLLALGACTRSPPTHHFILSSLATPGPLQGAPPSPGTIPLGTILIHPVEIPHYLNRSQMVTRTSANHLELSSSHLWGDPLQENISRVLLENLSFLLHTDRIFSSESVHRVRPRFRITTTVHQFEQGVDGRITLKTRWRLMDGPRRKVVLVRQSYFVGGPVPVGDYEAMTAAMSALLMQWSQEIAQAVRTVIMAEVRGASRTKLLRGSGGDHPPRRGFGGRAPKVLTRGLSGYHGSSFHA